MEKNNNIGGFLANEASRITEGPATDRREYGLAIDDERLLLCHTYQELMRGDDAAAEWKFMSELENFFLSPNSPFSTFYRPCGAPHPSTPCTFLQKRSFFQKFFPKLKEIPIKVGIQANLSSEVPYGYIIVYVPFMTNTKHITLRLLSSEALVVGDFPISTDAPNWVTIEADKIDFIHPIVPVGLRPFVAASLAAQYGWSGAQHVPSQLLLEKSPRQ